MPHAIFQLKRLQQQETVQLDTAALGELERLLGKYSELANGVGEAAVPKTPAATEKPAPLADVIATPVSRMSMGNERETRRAVLSMADVLPVGLR